MQDKLTLLFWWVVAFGVTTYLALGILDTLIVILH